MKNDRLIRCKKCGEVYLKISGQCPYCGQHNGKRHTFFFFAAAIVTIIVFCLLKDKIL